MPTANNGTLNFVGTSQQNLNGTATFFTKNVGFNTHSLTLNDTLKIDGTANFQSGIVSGSTNAMPIVFTQNANISTTNLPTDNSHINGVVLKQGTGIFAFPIGNATKYQGIEVNLSENNSGMLAAYAAQDAGTAPFAAAPSGSLPLYAYNNSEHWLLTPLDAASGTVKATWDSYNDLETPLITTNEARVAHLVNNEWRNEGGNNNSGTVNSGDVTSNTLNSWGKFTVGKECDVPTVFDVTGGGYVCENYDGTGLFIGLNNSQTGVSYQLKIDDLNVGNAVIGTGSAISFGDYLNPGTYTVVATSTRTSCKATMTGSAVLTLIHCATISGTQTIIAKDPANLVVAISGGVSPYTIVYNNGTADVTINNYVSGTNIVVTPSVTTTYTLVSMKDATNSNGLVGGVAIVTTIADITKPTITTSDFVIDNCNYPSVYPTNYTPTISDNAVTPPILTLISDVTATPTTICNAQSNPNLKYTKINTRTWKVTDNNGNTATKVQRIYLRDKIAPTAVCKNATITLAGTSATLTVAAINNGTTDNCTAIPSMSICQGGVTCTKYLPALNLAATLIPSGQTQVTLPIQLRGVDACSNIGYCTATVTLVKAV